MHGRMDPAFAIGYVLLIGGFRILGGVVVRDGRASQSWGGSSAGRQPSVVEQLTLVLVREQVARLVERRPLHRVDLVLGPASSSVVIAHQRTSFGPRR